MPDQISGFNGSVEFLREATYGTTPGTGTFEWFGHVTKATPKSTVELRELTRLRIADSTERRDVAEVNAGIEHHMVSVEFLAQTGVIEVLELALGATNAVADTLTSCSINAVALSGTAEMLAVGCVVNSCEISCEAGGEVEVSMEFIAQDISETTTVDLSFTSTDLVHATELSSAVLDYNNTVVTFSGTTLTLCTGWSFKIDNKLEERFRLGGSTGSPELLKDLVQKPVSVTGNLTMDVQDLNEYDSLLARADVTITIVIGARTFTFSGCKTSAMELGVGVEDLISASVPFVAESVTTA